MDRLDIPLYQDDLEYVSTCGVDWSVLEGSSIAISGATGMVGTFLVDLLMYVRDSGADFQILALGRNERKARERLHYFGRSGFAYEELDVSVLGARPRAQADIVVHLASATHPLAYALQPVGTIASNVTGLMNLLGYISDSVGEGSRFVFASSVEVYGQNRGDIERFDESYCGYLDCNTLRAGYPEAKRLGEALCQAYASEKGVRTYIPRLPRIYGPTLLPSDSKALSQFLHKAIRGEDVVLKSEGTQEFSYLYVADAVSGLLWVLTRGEAGIAYNVADEASDVKLRDLASACAAAGRSRVVFDLPNAAERAGYSTATKALMDGSRLRGLGWHAGYDLQEGIKRTVSILQVLQKQCTE